MRHSFIRHTRLSASVAAAMLALAAGPVQAIDLGGPALRGAVEADAVDPWAELASLDIEGGTAGNEDDLLDMMAREEGGEPAAAPERRSSVRTADPSTVAQNLNGPARAPEWEAPVPTTVSNSVAVYPRESYGTDAWGGGRPSVALLGY